MALCLRSGMSQVAWQLQEQYGDRYCGSPGAAYLYNLDSETAAKCRQVFTALALAGTCYGHLRKGTRRRKAVIRQATAIPTDFYSLLGLQRFQATRGDVRRAYHRVIKLVHPDVLGGETKELTSLVTSAYKTLSNEVMRDQYDTQLRQLSGGYGTGGTWEWSSNAVANSFNDDPAESSQSHRKQHISGKRRSTWSPSAPLNARPLFVDETRCVVCCRCVECAPDTFLMDSEGSSRARVFHQYGDTQEDVHWALESCPTSAISYVNRSDLSVLEDSMELIIEEHPDLMLSPTLSNYGKRLHHGPFDLLHRYKHGEPMPRGVARSNRGWPGARNVGRLGSQVPDAAGVASQIKEVVAPLPESVRAEAWPRDEHITSDS